MTYVALIGLTLVLVRSSLLNRLRTKVKILSCAQCSGWWVGLVGHLLVPSSSSIAFAGVRYVDAIVTAFAVSAMALVVNSLLTHFIGEVLTEAEARARAEEKK